MVKTLIVDDDAAARKTFGNILRAKGYDVEDAASGQAAISKVRTGFFNIVFIDVRMPDMGGLEVLKAINGINEDTVSIMVTAYASIDSSIEAMNKGAYSYILKPINMDQTMLVVDKALEKQCLSMENKRLLRELKEANEKLKDLDKRKSAFVSNVSHEFKNPLAAIKESLALILDGTMGEINKGQGDVLQLGKNSIERLIRLVTDLLDLSKIEAGKVNLNRTQFDFISLVNEVLLTYEGEILKKHFRIKKDIKQDTALIWADKDRISEVVINLLSNAMKYTPDPGVITIGISAADQDIRFEISDTGPGVAKENLEKIFDKFERIKAGKQEGTGLGLSIAKDIVELHKGKVWAESAPGQGSKFIVTLPCNLRKS